MSRLLVVNGPSTGVNYELGERTRIGRLGENEIQVSDPNVSRTHAEIVHENNSFVIYDRGSKNGVLVNGAEIAEKVLEPGDQIIIGVSTFVYDGTFRIQNARFSSNSVFVVNTTNDKSAGDMEFQTLSSESAAQDPSIKTWLSFASLFGGEPDRIPHLAKRLTGGIRQLFSADHAVLLIKDHVDSDLQPLYVDSESESVFLVGELLTKAASSGQAVSYYGRVDKPLVFSGSQISVPAGETPEGNEVNPILQKDNAEDEASHALTASMCAPIINQNQLLGILMVIKKSDREFTTQELTTFSVIAALASPMLYTVRTLEYARNAARSVLPADAEQRSASMRSLRVQEIYSSAKRSADSVGTVLITGETGTGKETLARYIHENGSRGNGPFVVFNCAAIPTELFEQELFGIESESADTTATIHGKIEEAQGGTLFLDEVGELDLSLQPILLRFLQDRAFYRGGSARAIETDIRVIASTSQDLAAAVRAGKFREDLWYRLNVVPFHMPPLRERREDIGPLVDFFIGRHAALLNRKVLGANDTAVALLQKYDWPGNIRELNNSVERAVLLAESKVLSVSDFAYIEEARRRLNSQADLERKRDTRPLAEVERQHIMIALKKHNFNQARAAEALGLHRNTLRNKIIEYGIEITK